MHKIEPFVKQCATMLSLGRLFKLIIFYIFYSASLIKLLILLNKININKINDCLNYKLWFMGIKN